jgi:hypothetical protein
MTKQEQITKLSKAQASLVKQVEEYKLAYGLLSDLVVDMYCAKRDGMEYFYKLVARLEETHENASRFFKS